VNVRVVWLSAALSLLLGTAAVAAPLGGAALRASDNPAAAAYCLQTGGAVETRIAAYGTNNGNPLLLAGMRQFCVYTANKYSKIFLLLETLYSPKPTLAALAYYAQTPAGSCNGSPGSCYCSLLGGTDLFGGINAAGGGWVLESDHSNVLDTCIFPDESSIDSYGLFYHSGGIIRGKDLSLVLRYHNPNR
jgi:hypothetical protein